MTDVTVVIGAGGIGQAIARRISSGHHILVANHAQNSADDAAKVLESAGFQVTAMQADNPERSDIQAVTAKAEALGPIKALIQAAGVSPSQAPIEAILNVDLYGTAVALEEFGKVMAGGCARAHPRCRLPAECSRHQSPYRQPHDRQAQDLHSRGR